MKKKNYNVIFIVLFLFFIVFYFQYAVTITWDSAHYMNYVNIFEGTAEWNTWDVVRGPVFPIIIFISNFIFGKTSQGLLMNSLFYYLIMILFSYKILDYFFKNIEITKKNKYVFLAVSLIIIIINPIIYGFYHTLLTEFVAITLSVLSCYLAILWVDTDYFKNKKKYLFINFIFIILTVFSWFLKQPYVSCSIFVFGIAYLISILKSRKLMNFICRTCTIASTIIILIISIALWNKILIYMGNNPNSDRNPTNSLGNQLVNAIEYLDIVDNKEIYNKDYIKSSKLDKKEKKEVLKLIKKKKKYVIIDEYKNNKIIDSDYIIVDDTKISTIDSILYVCKNFFNKPLKIMDAYLTNYLSIIDIYSTSTEDSIEYVSNKKIDLDFSNEISSISYKPYSYGSSNIFYMLPEMHDRVTCYEQTNYVSKILNYLMIFLGKAYLILFKLLFLLLPISLLTSIIMRIKSKNKLQNNKLEIIIILLGFSFLHVLLHVVTGAIIDRYAIPAFISTYFGIILLGYLLIFRKKINSRKVRKLNK